ncbi:hypothetical protein QBC47DRAFT_2228 [Echria macrotheca]|uniref:Uncharacterized protein n=1 Tax=Echria macrotheca TaxID=438768 RepID=A0AAJ0BNQ8_9PEZI|nr:hypothetical protein QBC47DRAFT_2228 [Echria macrotheca]
MKALTDAHEIAIFSSALFTQPREANAVHAVLFGVADHSRPSCRKKSDWCFPERGCRGARLDRSPHTDTLLSPSFVMFLMERDPQIPRISRQVSLTLSPTSLRLPTTIPVLGVFPSRLQLVTRSVPSGRPATLSHRPTTPYACGPGCLACLTRGDLGVKGLSLWGDKKPPRQGSPLGLPVWLQQQPVTRHWDRVLLLVLYVTAGPVAGPGRRPGEGPLDEPVTMRSPLHQIHLAPSQVVGSPNRPTRVI